MIDINDLHSKMISEAERREEEMYDLTPAEIEDYMQAVVDTTSIVLGAFPDQEAPGGVGMFVIKGMSEVATMLEIGAAGRFSITAIPCLDLEHAFAARKLFVDKSDPAGRDAAQAAMAAKLQALEVAE